MKSAESPHSVHKKLVIKILMHIVSTFVTFLSFLLQVSEINVIDFPKNAIVSVRKFVHV